MSIRADKWLWAARFYKTRRLATDAIKSGHILVNDQRVKPSKIIIVGQKVTIKKAPIEYQVLVLSISDRRQSAPIAQTMYQETSESIKKREYEKELRKSSSQPLLSRNGRPTKRDRRKIVQFISLKDNKD